MVQHNLRDRRAGNEDDGQDPAAIERRTSGTRNGEFYGTGEVQHLDQRHSSGNSIEGSNSETQMANTEVTTDIIFLQKREHPVILKNEPNWIGLGYTEDNVPVNQYYLDNPQMLLDKMVFFKKMYGNENDTGLVALEEENIETGLNNVVQYLNARIENNVSEKEDNLEEYIPADPEVKNFTYVVKDQNLYYKENSRMVKVNLPGKTIERVKGLCEIRTALRQVIDIQTEGCTLEELKPYQEALLNIYNDFTYKYGVINSQVKQNCLINEVLIIYVL